MPIKKSDRIIAPSRLTGTVATTLLGKLDRPSNDDERAIEQLKNRSVQMGIDGAVAASQIVWETNNLEDDRAVTDYNYAGVSITGDDVVQPFRIAGPEDGIDLYLQCLYSAVTHKRFAGFPVPASCEQWFKAVWLPKVQSPTYPTVKTIDDLNIIYDGNRATWAADPEYQDGVPSRGNQFMPGLPDQDEFTSPVDHPSEVIPVPGYSVPTPTIYNLATDYARYGLSQSQANEIINSRFTNRNGGVPRYIVLHIQDGNTRGSLSYWSSASIDASSTVMVQKDGTVLRIVPEQHGPWTNGDVNQPTWQANGIIGLGGNPNNWSLTVEAEGGPWDTMPAAQRDAIIWVCEDWMIRYPEIDSVSKILRHGWINSVSRPNCPGTYFQAVVDEVSEWKQAPAPEPEPEPEPVRLYPPGMTFELARELYEAQGKFTAGWTSKQIGFDPNRAECQYWLARGKLSMTDPKTYKSGQWPSLTKIIRRGKTKNVHAYVYSNGDVYEKVIRKDA